MGNWARLSRVHGFQSPGVGSLAGSRGKFSGSSTMGAALNVAVVGSYVHTTARSLVGSCVLSAEQTPPAYTTPSRTPSPIGRQSAAGEQAESGIGTGVRLGPVAVACVAS